MWNVSRTISSAILVEAVAKNIHHLIIGLVTDEGRARSSEHIHIISSIRNTIPRSRIDRGRRHHLCVSSLCLPLILFPSLRTVCALNKCAVIWCALWWRSFLYLSKCSLFSLFVSKRSMQREQSHLFFYFSSLSSSQFLAVFFLFGKNKKKIFC